MPSTFPSIVFACIFFLKVMRWRQDLNRLPDRVRQGHTRQTSMHTHTYFLGQFSEINQPNSHIFGLAKNLERTFKCTGMQTSGRQISGRDFDATRQQYSHAAVPCSQSFRYFVGRAGKDCVSKVGNNSDLIKSVLWYPWALDRSGKEVKEWLADTNKTC